MRKNALRALLLVGCMLLLNACQSLPVSFSTGETCLMTCGRESLSEAEVRLVALQYKCRFEQFYSELLGGDFWEKETEDGLSFEAYVKEYYVFRECKALLYLNALAGETGLKIDEVYDNDFKEAAEAYYASLSRDELRYCGASAADVEKLMRKYVLASLEIDAELEGKNVEVSEEESRVADVQIIRVTDYELALSLSERIGEGESFLTLAQENTLDSRIDYSVCKGELIPELDELIFGMEDDEISEVTAAGENYYLVRLVNSYNVLMSSNHKSNLAAEKRFLAWESLYTEQEESLSVSRNNRVYEKITLSRTGDYPYEDLFSCLPVIQ